MLKRLRNYFWGVKKQQLLNHFNSLLSLTENGDLETLLTKAKALVDVKRKDLTSLREEELGKIQLAEKEFSEKLALLRNERDKVALPAKKVLGEVEAGLIHLTETSRNITFLEDEYKA